MDIQAKRDIFIKMNKAILTCQKCRLCKGRKNAVVGEGNINASMVFIGEAPGSDEDSHGRPLVGKSGMLLNELMRRVGIDRRTVWIGNIIKCMPPENRDPMVDELRACRPFLDRQLEIIKPKIVVTLGRFALEYFLPKAKIAEVHGKPLRVKNFILFPMYHPSAALRNEIIKKILVDEFRTLKTVSNLSVDSIAYHESLQILKDESDLKSLF